MSDSATQVSIRADRCLLPLNLHGATQVAAAAAVATMKIMLADGFMDEVRSKGAYLAEQLNSLAGRYPRLAVGVRGSGLLQALVLTDEGIGQGPAIVERLFTRGVLINFAGNSVLRFMPPLVVSRQEIDVLIAGLDMVIAEITD